MKDIFQFLGENWVNVALVIVGLSALAIYILQERKKENEAASLIVMQIDDLERRLREVSSYIVEKQVNFTAFYESLPLMSENYWSKYKHYFINRMDHKSFSDITLFFDFASEIQEQQLFLKQLQKDSFSNTQSVLSRIESQLLATELSPAYSKVTPQDIIVAINGSLPHDTPENIRNTILSIGQQFASQNPGFDLQQSLIRYNQQRQRLESFIDQNVLTNYTPVQIRISIEKILKEYSMLNISGNSGYQMLTKLSHRKF